MTHEDIFKEFIDKLKSVLRKNYFKYEDKKINILLDSNHTISVDWLTVHDNKMDMIPQVIGNFLLIKFVSGPSRARFKYQDGWYLEYCDRLDVRDKLIDDELFLDCIMSVMGLRSVTLQEYAGQCDSVYFGKRGQEYFDVKSARLQELLSKLDELDEDCKSPLTIKETREAMFLSDVNKIRANYHLENLYQLAKDLDVEFLVPNQTVCPTCNNQFDAMQNKCSFCEYKIVWK